MNIFIESYHLVKKFLDLPKTIVAKKQQRKLEEEYRKEQDARKKKLLKETVGAISSIEQAEEMLTADEDNNKERSELFTFDYLVKDERGKTVKSSFDAKSSSEVEAFLSNEGYEIVNIELRKKNIFNMEISLGGKIKSGELSFMLTQLSTYLKAGIPLIDSVRILSKQATKPARRKVYEKIVYDLVAGEKFSKALENQSSVFPRLLINMIKTSEMTGDLPATLDEMSDYYNQIYKTKKQMITALIYPFIVFVVSIAVVIFCLVYVVPSFVKMYAETEASLPKITVITMSLSDFFSQYYMTIIAVAVIGIIAFISAYHNLKSFRRRVQTIMMKMPVIGNIIIYSEVSMFTRTFAQLINHSVHITDTMAILSKISSNEIYKDIIANTLDTLSKGGKISESFHQEWAFPIVAYEMLVTGESTGKLGEMMEKVADHYSNLHQSAITTIKSLLEPITIIFLATAVGFILLSIVIPMFDIYGAVGSMN